MSGEVRLRVKSKPLEKNLIEDIVIDLRQLHSLSRQIQVAAKKSEELTGRRGCSTEELYEILSKYFGDQIKKFLKLTATELALNALIRDKGESKTVNGVKRAWSGAVNAAMNYAQSVGDKSLKQFGLGKDELNSVKDAIFKSRMSPKTNDDGNNFDSFSVEEPRDDD
jgi:AraC-like DNA-binding protein